MTFLVTVPPGRDAERAYAVEVVLKEFLGLDIAIVAGTGGEAVSIEADGVSLTIADVFFRQARTAWLDASTLPAPHFDTWDAAKDGITAGMDPLPVIFGSGAPWILRDSDSLHLNVDVIGAAFFMLTRYEEAAVAIRDEHGRFPARAAVADRAGFLERPLIDEYVIVLDACIRSLWPRLPRRAASFRVVSTHDVDEAFAHVGRGALGAARSVAGRLVKDHSLRDAQRTLTDWRAVRRGGADNDPFSTYRTIMSDCEDAGERAAFYFIPDPDPVGRGRDPYTLGDPDVRALLREISSRGHEIGIHPSYRSHLDGARLATELDTLHASCDAIGIALSAVGGRQHFLRWEARGTFRLWDDVGLAYDSTLGYAETPGFRTGVCRPYPTFDLMSGRRLALRERPLIVMDVTLSNSAYLGLDPAGDDAKALVARLRDRCRNVGGEFVILWHNNVLADPAQVSLYRQALLGDGTTD